MSREFNLIVCNQFWKTNARAIINTPLLYRYVAKIETTMADKIEYQYQLNLCQKFRELTRTW